MAITDQMGLMLMGTIDQELMHIPMIITAINILLIAMGMVIMILTIMDTHIPMTGILLPIMTMTIITENPTTILITTTNFPT